jgi:hypothetical protein
MVGRTKPTSVPTPVKEAEPAPATPLWVILSNQAGELEREPTTDPRHAQQIAVRMLALLLEFPDGYSIRAEKESKNLVPLKP